MGILENTINEISDHNSTTLPLLANNKFTGLIENTLAFSSLEVNIYSNSGSATNGLVITCGQDKELITGIYIETDTYTAGTNYHRVFPLYGKYMRIEYTNGGDIQTAFKLQAIKTNQPPDDNGLSLFNILSNIDIYTSNINIKTEKPLTLYRTENKCRILQKSFNLASTSNNSVYICNNTSNKTYYIYDIDYVISPEITTCDRVNINLTAINNVYTANGYVLEYNNPRLFTNYSNVNLIGFGNNSNLTFGSDNTSKTLISYNLIADGKQNNISFEKDMLEIPSSNTILISASQTFNNPTVYFNIKWIEEDI
jgi:hypothetical protein